MKRRPLTVLVALALVAGGGCGGAHRSHPDALYLTLVHQPLAGQLASQDSARLLVLGHQACADMDAGAPPDRVVADLAGNSEPGSADFNAYAFVAVAASRYLCPAHQGAFTGGLPGTSGSS